MPVPPLPLMLEWPAHAVASACVPAAGPRPLPGVLLLANPVHINARLAAGSLRQPAASSPLQYLKAPSHCNASQDRSHKVATVPLLPRMCGCRPLRHLHTPLGHNSCPPGHPTTVTGLPTAHCKQPCQCSSMLAASAGPPSPGNPCCGRRAPGLGWSLGMQPATRCCASGSSKTAPRAWSTPGPLGGPSACGATWSPTLRGGTHRPAPPCHCCVPAALRHQAALRPPPPAPPPPLPRRPHCCCCCWVPGGPSSSCTASVIQQFCQLLLPPWRDTTNM